MSNAPLPIVAGNWKMNGDLAKVADFVSNVQSIDGVEIVLCPPSVYLSAAQSPNFALGAQTCSEFTEGAHTGEISVDMLKSVSCRYVILGHSERREDQGETNEQVAAKVKTVLTAGLVPILCVGESLEVRDAGKVFEFIGAQLDAVIDMCGAEFIEKGVLAYEPIWAIGTGKTASPMQAQEVHAFIRTKLKEVSGEASSLSILYGGSVKPDNAQELFAQPDINGGLIGGASLDVKSFNLICQAAK